MTKISARLKYFPLTTLVAAVLAGFFCETSARAQLMLPGALQAAPPAGAEPGNSSQPAPAPAKPKPVAEKRPDEAAILGRDLSQNGSAGSIAFQMPSSKGLEVTRLSLLGEAISHPGEQCRVDVVADAPIDAKFSGRPNGVARYDVAIEACPFSLDVLEGAVLVMRAEGACDFAAADCRVDPTGLWGPAGNAIDPAQIKQMERERGRAETSMRANYHALAASAGKDKAAIKRIAGEQAGFSSAREVMCRNYLREEAHGFCALRMTQARVFALRAEFDAKAKGDDGEKPLRAAMKKKPRPAPAAAAEPPPN
ncbi:hypothetical protein [Methylocapsa aurea]|uniref:hypothetical protein n=1 Tax=Methylocapsa aurea TaxID=663610 RepID=UPI000690E9BF|nr:hypothetical protein [Methylocapsa aurea]